MRLGKELRWVTDCQHRLPAQQALGGVGEAEALEDVVLNVLEYLPVLSRRVRGGSAFRFGVGGGLALWHRSMGTCLCTASNIVSE